MHYGKGMNIATNMLYAVNYYVTDFDIIIKSFEFRLLGTNVKDIIARLTHYYISTYLFWELRTFLFIVCCIIKGTHAYLHIHSYDILG